MNILVAISKTPDTTAKITLRDTGQSIDEGSLSFIMNPYDEWYALVRALELQEKLGGKVTLVHVGLGDSETIIRKGLAIGAQEAIRVNAVPESATMVAHQIAKVAESGDYDLILLGKESIDYNGSSVGAMVAELLNLPFVSYVNHLELEGEEVILKREIEGGVEACKAATPLVVSAAKGLAEQRIPNMRGIMMAKSKPLQVIEPVPVSFGAQAVRYELPAEKSGVHLVAADDMKELVRLLHEEAKVI
jgi:electron transfer flavoprotein beta subunit